MSKLHLERVDGMRGLAILLVFAYHLLITLFPGYEVYRYDLNGVLEINSWQNFLFLFSPFGEGWIGVDLFLIISGFLIHLIHLRSGKPFNASLFFSKRFWRIYPPYLLVLLFFYIKNLDTSSKGITEFLTHAFLVHNLNNKTIYALNPSFWSIALECQLYFLYPLYLILLSRIGMLRSFVAVVLIYITFSMLGVFFPINTPVNGVSVLKYWFVWCAGALLADRFHNNKRLFHHPFTWFLFSYFLFILFRFFSYSSGFILIPVTLTCLSLMEVILYSGYLDKFIVRTLFSGLSFLGICSYSIYLIHQPYLKYLIDFFNPATGYTLFNRIIQVSFTIIVIVLISYALYQLIEIKSIEYGQRIRNKKRASGFDS